MNCILPCTLSIVHYTTALIDTSILSQFLLFSSLHFNPFMLGTVISPVVTTQEHVTSSLLNSLSSSLLSLAGFIA